jgi:two-component system chemotaxis sensor kinase CheA
VSTAAHQPENPFFAEFLDDFFAECDEHLTAVRGALLELEPFVRRADVDRQLLDTLFRGFHSLKGLAGMVGVADVERLAHQMESYLRALRQQHIVLSAEALEALIDGTRMLERLLGALRSDGPAPDIALVLGRLAAITPPEPDEPAAAPSSQPNGAAAPEELNAEERAALAAARERGARAWRFVFAPNAELAERGVNVNLVRERLQSIGEVIRATPRVTQQSGIAFEFLVASSADEQLFAAWAPDGISYAPADPPATARNGAAPLPVAPSHVVRVDIGRLDDLMRLAGDLVISRARMADQVAALKHLLPVAEWRALQETSQALERQLRELRAGVMRIRMVPIGDVFTRMQFVVRDLARELGKQVTLQQSGQDTEIDKFVVERMLDPLMHLVRNAVSHGLELPGERAARGKPPQGLIQLRASTAGDAVLVEIEDDGRGLDTLAVAAQGRALGLWPADTPLDPAHLLDIICAPGFSTRDQADYISGRGIGMNVVQKTVRELGGTLTLATQPERGTRFAIELPLTLAIMDALIVEAGGQTFAVPLPAVREVLRAQAGEITALENNQLMLYRGGVLPLIRLAAQFGLAEAAGPVAYVFVVGGQASPAGIMVDRIVGKREIVVRPIDDPLIQIRGIAGATELGDGRAVLILDTAALVGAR